MSERHQRVLREGESIFFAVTERRAESIFFWRVLSLSTMSLFFLSLIPQFTVSSFRSFEEQVPLQNTPEDEIVFLEDGFLQKPEKRTEKGDRSNVVGILEYRVVEGDTLSRIGEKFGISEESILQNNGFFSKDSLVVGSVLRIPPENGLIHRVSRGETLLALSQKYRTDVQKIMQQNGLKEGDDLIAGKDILIPGVMVEQPKPLAAAVSVAKKPARTAAGIAPGRETFGKLLFPTQGKYTQQYHYGHYAVDIATNGGAPIWAAEGGTVIRAEYGWNGGYGNVIVIDHGNGLQTLYAHNKELYVATGDVVTRGQPIAFMGKTGRVYGRTGIHLHFEVIIDGSKVNPTRYF